MQCTVDLQTSLALFVSIELRWHERTVFSVGTPSSLLPHPPKDRAPDRASSKRQQSHSSGKDRQALSGTAAAHLATWTPETNAFFCFGLFICRRLIWHRHRGSQPRRMQRLMAEERQVKVGRGAPPRAPGVNPWTGSLGPRQQVRFWSSVSGRMSWTAARCGYFKREWR